MTDAGSTRTGSTTVQHHHFQQSRRRLRQLLRPNGRKVHVASNPEEIDRLTTALTNSEPEGSFDVVIHGSPEHIEVLREVHSHNENERQQLREKFGAQFDEFEKVIRQVDELGHELYSVSENAVQLDANFSKYGYSARLRTKESPNASSANSLNDDHESQRQEDFYRASRKQGDVMKFWKQPIVRQYFHKGLLWRAEEQQEVGSYELFVDLFYVGIIAVSGDNATEEANGRSLLSFAITFILAWKFWSDITLFISWFDSDDILRRLKVLLQLACLLGMTTCIANALDETYTPLICFYLAARLLNGIHFIVLCWLIPMVRPVMIGNAIAVFIPALLWIGSIHVEDPNRQILIWIAIIIDLFATFFIIFVQRLLPMFLPEKIGDRLKNAFEFQPATNIEHRIERTGAFVTLVFGYSVISILYQSHVNFGLNAFFGKAILGLIQAFAFNWIYFEIDNFNLHTHAIRRHVVSSMTWMSIHLPFIMSFTLSGASLAKLVLAHDCENADPETLWEIYEERSEEHLSDGQRWFYCAGLGIALACMGIISVSHIHKKIPGERIGKHKRLVLRFAVSIILILLPLAGDRLNSLELVATTTGLVILVLLFDLFGSTCTGQSFWSCPNKCEYSARCRLTRQDFEKSLKNGEILKVEELAENEKVKQGGFHV